MSGIPRTESLAQIHNEVATRTSAWLTAHETFVPAVRSQIIAGVLADRDQVVTSADRLELIGQSLGVEGVNEPVPTVDAHLGRLAVGDPVGQVVRHHAPLRFAQPISRGAPPHRRATKLRTRIA